jgi:cytochrome c2
MFDTMTLTKTAGALCGALLIFLLGGWAAELIYSSGGHGDDHAQGYVIDTGEDEVEEDTANDEPDLAQMFASAEPSKGERVFNQCRACHNLEEGENGVGPHLYGVVAREVGSVDGFSYSGALSEAADVWSAEELYAFLENPQGYAPGTSMGYSGLSKPEDRANLITYLDQTDGEDNIELAAAETDGASEEEAADEGASDEGTTEDTAADESASDEGATEEAAADESASDDGTTEDAAADESASEEGATEETADAGASDEGASEDSTADAGASEFATMVASADASAGERIYRQCQACHQIENERNGVGPHLVGVVGRDIASVDGFNYSDALTGLDGAWTLDKLSAWIENPREFAPGNRMGYQGLSDEQDRADLMAYLESAGN